MTERGLQVTVKNECMVEEKDAVDKDLVVSVGGDSTYLRAAGLIPDSSKPILGVNSDPARWRGALLNLGIPFESREQAVKGFLDALDKGQFKYFNRTRSLFKMNERKHLCLNEVFAAEKDVSITSMFRMVVNGKALGKFKSSGLLISTGTGSSGWLYWARQIT